MGDFENRINELFQRSLSRNIFTFTDFLNPTKAEEVKKEVGEKNVTFFGGSDFSERTMARFGDKDELGYEEDFPVKLLKISITAGKFAVPVTHRDVLGATLNLGVERDKTGDIFIDGGNAYIFVHESVAPLILSELKTVSRNPVIVTEEESLPESLRPKTEETEISVASNRADAVISRLYNFSRDESSALFKSGFVSLNGKQLEKSEKTLKSGDVVTVRGKGKFVFVSEGGISKKGKLYVKLNVYK